MNEESNRIDYDWSDFIPSWLTFHFILAAAAIIIIILGLALWRFYRNRN